MAVLTVEKINPAAQEVPENGTMSPVGKLIRELGQATLLVPDGFNLDPELSGAGIFTAPSGAKWIRISDPNLAERFVDERRAQYGTGCFGI